MDNFCFFSFSSVAWFKDILSVCPSIYPPTDPSVHPSVFLSTHLSVCHPPAHSSTYPSSLQPLWACPVQYTLYSPSWRRHSIMTVLLDPVSLLWWWKPGSGKVKQVSIIMSFRDAGPGRSLSMFYFKYMLLLLHLLFPELEDQATHSGSAGALRSDST